MSEPNEKTAAVWIWCDDLLFVSRLSDVCRRLGVAQQVVRDPQQLERSVAEATPRLLIVDLSADGLRRVELIERLRKKSPQLRVVAFGPHVDETTLSAARAAGCHAVLSKGQLHRQMDDVLAQALS